MSWSINNRQEAQLGGADLTEDRLLLGITPGYVAERYQDHRAADTGDHNSDHWEKLTKEEREAFVQAVDDYCDTALMRIDNDIANIFSRAEQVANAHAG